MKNVLIIGGGPSGIEAASWLKRMGHNVILVEQQKELGGKLLCWDRLFPSFESAQQLLSKLLTGLEGVTVFTNTSINSINLLNKSYNVILSNGVTVLSDALLISTGFDLFKAEKKEEYGYGIYDNVLTSLDLESYFKNNFQGFNVEPKKIGFVHCVGSRDEKVLNRGCSKVCCVTAIKQACELKKQFPDSEIFCFYMDLRMFGRGWEDIYLNAQKDYGIRCIRGRVSEVSENQDKTLLVKAEDTLSSKPVKVTLDMLVLMCGMRPSVGGVTIKKMLNLQTEDDGFFSTADNIFSLQQSRLDGLFFAGAATGPKTLPDSLHEARSAAVEIDKYLSQL